MCWMLCGVSVWMGSYHYFYWGGSQSGEAYRDHDRILRMLHDITDRRVIFSGRLEYERLSHHPRQVARHAHDRAGYTTRHFLAAAERYFTIEERGFLDRSPLLVLHKR